MSPSRLSAATALLPRWQDLTLLIRRAADRPRWQLIQAVIVSLWTAAWIVGQIGPPEARLSPLDVPGGVLAFFGVDVAETVHSVGLFLGDPQRRTVLLLCAWGAGLLWAATTERSQYPALVGWLLVMASAEGIGYHQAIYRAVLAMVGLVVVLYLCSLPLHRVPVCRRARLLPRDVLGTGFAAGALSAVIPLLAAGILVTRVCSPYLTRPPELVGPVRSPIRPEGSATDDEPVADARQRAAASDTRPTAEDTPAAGFDIPGQARADHDAPSSMRPASPPD